MYRVAVSTTAARYLRNMPTKEGERLREALRSLEEDPFHSRSGADIVVLRGARGRHRLRIGPWRVVYEVRDRGVRILEVFRRGRGYR